MSKNIMELTISFPFSLLKRRIFMIIAKRNLFIFQEHINYFICPSNIEIIFQIRKFVFLVILTFENYREVLVLTSCMPWVLVCVSQASAMEGSVPTTHSSTPSTPSLALMLVPSRSGLVHSLVVLLMLWDLPLKISFTIPSSTSFF